MTTQSTADRAATMRARACWSISGRPVALQGAHASVRVNDHYQQVAAGSRSFQVAHMARVQQVKAAVGQHQAAPVAPRLVRKLARSHAVHDLVCRVHISLPVAGPSASPAP